MDLRNARHDRTHDKLLDAAVRVLQRGELLTFASVATQARVPERTVYRHFTNRERLRKEAWGRVLAKFGNQPPPSTFEEYGVHVGRSFDAFSRAPELVRAILRSPEIQAMRRTDEDERRRGLRRLARVGRAGADVPIEDAAALLRVLHSAPAWELLTQWGLTARRAAAVVEFGAARILGVPPRRPTRRRPSR